MNKPILKITTSYIKNEKDRKLIASFIHEMNRILSEGEYKKISTITDNEFQMEVYRSENVLNRMLILVRNVLYNEKYGIKEDTYTLFYV